MDDKLKEDIKDAFQQEYFKNAQSDDNRFFKSVRSFLDGADKVAGRLHMNGPGALLAVSVALIALAPPVGIAALAGWFGVMGSTVAATITANIRADKALEADIDNGKLTERYHAVLDTKERELAETQDLYKAQRAQLPPKGAAVEAFANAGKDTVAAAPAPATPSAQPKP